MVNYSCALCGKSCNKAKREVEFKGLGMPHPVQIERVLGRRLHSEHANSGWLCNLSRKSGRDCWDQILSVHKEIEENSVRTRSGAATAYTSRTQQAPLSEVEDLTIRIYPVGGRGGLPIEVQ